MRRRPVLAQTVLALVAFAVTGCGGGATDSGAAPAGTGAPTADGDPVYVVQRVEVGHLPCGILGADGKVWVSLYGDDSVVWIDPATGEVGPPITTGDQPCGLAFGAGSIWVED